MLSRRSENMWEKATHNLDEYIYKYVRVHGRDCG